MGSPREDSGQDWSKKEYWEPSFWGRKQRRCIQHDHSAPRGTALSSRPRSSGRMEREIVDFLVLKLHYGVYESKH